MDIYTLLVIVHLVGTVLGVGGATMIEVHLNRAIATGMSPDHRALLGLNFTVLRIGLVLGLFSGFGFVAYYIANEQYFRLENPLLWFKLFMVIVVAVNALLLQAHKIGLYWGSALSFVTWWTLFLVGTFASHNIRVDLMTLFISYVFSVVVGAVVLHQIREVVKKRFAKKES